jgi:RNA polymerase sigma factor (sigma-70 family)
MMPEVIDAKTGGLEITAITKLRHTVLFELAKDFGSQRNLARHLGVTFQELGYWVRLQRKPPLSPIRTWTQERIDSLEKDLFDLTGQTLHELFPLPLSSGFWKANKTSERTEYIPQSKLISLERSNVKRIAISPEPGPQEQAEAEEVARIVSRIVGTLPDRQCYLLSLRYGLRGHKVHSLGEIAKLLKITEGRVRQIQAMAERKITKELSQIDHTGNSLHPNLTPQ